MYANYKKGWHTLTVIKQEMWMIKIVFKDIFFQINNTTVCWSSLSSTKAKYVGAILCACHCV